MKKIEHTTKFRVLKSTWGIAINITGTLSTLAESKASNFNLELSNRFKLSEHEITQLREGILLMESHLPKFYVIQITEIWFNPCDYQPNGLKWAMVHWVSEVLKMEILEYSVIFNKEINQYEFNT